jgi:protoporphyrinogen oxidase
MTYFMSFKNGMETLSRACTDYLGTEVIKLGAPVKAIEPKGNRYVVHRENGDHYADHVSRRSRVRLRGNGPGL